MGIAAALLLCAMDQAAWAENTAEPKLEAPETQPADDCDGPSPCEPAEDTDVRRAAEQLFRERFNTFDDPEAFDGNPMARFGFGHCHRYGTEMFCH